MKYSGFFSGVLRNKAVVSLFWEIWGPRRLPSDHKIGRKFPFGQKHHQMGSKVIQEDDCPKEEFQDEPIKHILQNVPEMISSFLNLPFLANFYKITGMSGTYYYDF